jgi:hypothetical protein
MVDFERETIFGRESRCDFLWCLHCERAYPYGKFRLKPSDFSESDLEFIRSGSRWSGSELRALRDDLQMCPYDGCSGDAVLDAWDWNKVREVHPEYPAIPLYGVVYPLY